MGIVERFTEYAQVFEEAYDSDDWSVLEPYFTEDAVYDFIAGPPLGGRHESRATILSDFQAAVNGFDRRFASRRLEVLEGPLEKNGEVWMRWAATLHPGRRAGLPHGRRGAGPSLRETGSVSWKIKSLTRNANVWSRIWKRTAAS